MERFHQAENGDKPSRAEFVRELPCTAPDTCDAKAACLKATGPTGQALRLKAEVERGLAALDAKTLSVDDPLAKALPAKLDEAQRLLEEGHRALPDCDARLLQLRRAYRL